MSCHAERCRSALAHRTIDTDPISQEWRTSGKRSNQTAFETSDPIEVTAHRLTGGGTYIFDHLGPGSYSVSSGGGNCAKINDSLCIRPVSRSVFIMYMPSFAQALPSFWWCQHTASIWRVGPVPCEKWADNFRVGLGRTDQTGPGGGVNTLTVHITNPNRSKVWNS